MDGPASINDLQISLLLIVICQVSGPDRNKTRLSPSVTCTMINNYVTAIIDNNSYGKERETILARFGAIIKTVITFNLRK
jgi:hypothetical protein